MKRVFKIRSEDGEAYVKIISRPRDSMRRREKPSWSELLFKLLDLRLGGKADGEAYFELLSEYLSRASETGLDREKLREYISKMEAVGDRETLKLIGEIKPEALRDG